MFRKLSALMLSGLCLMGACVDVHASSRYFEDPNQDISTFPVNLDFYPEKTYIRSIYDRQYREYLLNIHEMALVTNYKVVRDGKIIRIVPNEGSKMLVEFEFDESKGTGYAYERKNKANRVELDGLVNVNSKYYMYPDQYFNNLGYKTDYYKIGGSDKYDIVKPSPYHNAFMTSKEKELLKKYETQLKELLDVECGCEEKGLTGHNIKGDDAKYLLYAGEVTPLLCRTINNFYNLENATEKPTTGDKAFRKLYIEEDAKMRSENYSKEIGKHLVDDFLVNEKYVKLPYFYSPDFAFMQDGLLSVTDKITRGHHEVGKTHSNQEMMLDLYAIYSMSNAVFGTNYAVPRIDSETSGDIYSYRYNEQNTDNPYRDEGYNNSLFIVNYSGWEEEQ